MKTIKLPYGIEVEIKEHSATICSGLREACPHCGEKGCHHDCDGSQGADDENERDAGRDEFNAAVDGMESLILAVAGAGIDIESLAFAKAVETAVDAITNKYGD